MYLKQVELENFKSFGGKIAIPLMEGYMAVTGPNGSGKSNIGDAILFVLGPKSSKAVRAGRITDLIFDGGASKSKAKSMTVSLVFDNSDRMMPWDADEVRLTRFVKLAVNGTDYSSYFYINGQKSSLSEFDTLLTKARISADGYNLVQQGDVTRIVEMGAVERRRVLDGISGIASFDADIQKAQSERAEADANLGSVGIIEGEKSRRLKALEKDKQEAEVYLKAKQESETANAQLRVRLRDNRAAALGSIEQTIARTDAEIEEAKRTKADRLAQKDANEKEISSMEAEIERRAGPEYRKVKEDVEAARVALSTEKDRMEQADSDKAKQIEFRRRFEEDLENNAAGAKEQAEALADLSAKRDEAAAAKEAADAEEARISDETSRHGGEITELQKKIDALDVSIDEAGAGDQALQAEAAAKSAVTAEAERAVADAEEALESARFAVKDAEWNLSEVKKAVGPVTDVSELGAKVVELKKKEAGYEKQEADLRAIASARADEFNRLSAEKRVSESYNSRNAAVSSILAMKESGEIRGIHGTIAQLATVEKGWETALSVAAGSKMTAVVVDDDAVAAECISYLRENKLGRVTFLPLNKMLPGKPRAKAIMAVKSTRGYATDMIDFDPRYTNAFWYVFGDTMLVDGMDQARSIMGGVRLVTRAGDLVEASGAMVGGTVNTKAIPKFGASSQSELDKAAAAKREADDALAGVMERLRGVRDEIRAADDAMREANATGADARGRIAEAEASAKSAKRDLDAAKQALEDKRAALAEARKASDGAAKAASESQAALEGLRGSRAEARARMQEIAPADLQERIQKARDAAYLASKELSDVESQIGGVKAEISGLEKQREAIEAQIAAVDEAVARDEEESAAHAAALEERRKDLEALKAIAAEMESGLEDLRAKRDVLLQNRYSLDSEIDKAQSAVEVKEGYRLGQEAQARQAREDIAALEEEIAKSPVEAPLPIPSEEALRSQIKECQRRMDAVGNVNLRALEDYDATKAELDGLHEQMSRLEKQIKGLDDLAADLTSKKKGLFMAAYEAVDANFKAIYAELSGGGEGYMALDDPDDPFAGGLQINAKPRNGKLLRLEALSGGEKSLTALSFIFAIQEYQPSPFYMLDEVDMFLDAVNAEMVAKRVKVSSAKAQFIQVSLRKVTLTQADHLIGVTRPPTGVSRVIMQPDIEEVSKYEEEALRRQSEAGEGRREGGANDGNGIERADGEHGAAPAVPQGAGGGRGDLRADQRVPGDPEGRRQRGEAGGPGGRERPRGVQPGPRQGHGPLGDRPRGVRQDVLPQGVGREVRHDRRGQAAPDGVEDSQPAVRRGQEEGGPGRRARGIRGGLRLRGRGPHGRPGRPPLRGVRQEGDEAGHHDGPPRRLRGRPQGRGDPEGQGVGQAQDGRQGPRQVRQQGPPGGRRAHGRRRVREDPRGRRRPPAPLRLLHRVEGGQHHRVRVGAPPREGREARRDPGDPPPRGDPGAGEAGPGRGGAARWRTRRPSRPSSSRPPSR